MHNKEKKRLIYWDEVNMLIQKLHAKIDYDSIKNIYPIPRGGLVVGTKLSYLSNKPLIKIPKKDTLITDNLADTGKTLEPFKDFTTATLHYKPWSKVEPTYWIEETEDWIVYPWEVFI